MKKGTLLLVLSSAKLLMPHVPYFEETWDCHVLEDISKNLNGTFFFLVNVPFALVHCTGVPLLIKKSQKHVI